MLLAVGVAHVALGRARANGVIPGCLLDRRSRVFGSAGPGAGRHTLGVVRRLALGTLLLLAAACANSHGPWIDADGNRVPSGLVLEFDGPSSCGWSSVTFIRFFGAQYARPGEGAGRAPGRRRDRAHLRRGDQAAIRAEPTGVTHGDREILIDEVQREDYLFMAVGDSLVERWPRSRADLSRDAWSPARGRGVARSIDERHLVDVAPRPHLARLQRPDYGMTGLQRVALACLLGELSQQAAWPQLRHMRR